MAKKNKASRKKAEAKEQTATDTDLKGDEEAGSSSKDVPREDQQISPSAELVSNPPAELLQPTERSNVALNGSSRTTQDVDTIPDPLQNGTNGDLVPSAAQLFEAITLVGDNSMSSRSVVEITGESADAGAFLPEEESKVGHAEPSDPTETDASPIVPIDGRHIDQEDRGPSEHIAASETADMTHDLSPPAVSDGQLRQELEELRKALLRSKEDQKAMKLAMDELNAKADRLIEEKTLAETQYRSLFSKVTQMKSTLGARLKQDAEELSQNRTTIEDLEAQNAALTDTIAHMQEQVVMSSEASSATKLELKRAREEVDNLATSMKELEADRASERLANEQLQQKNLMAAAEWENLAIEERSARDTLRDRIHDLDEQLAAQNTAYDNLRTIVEQDNQAIAKFKQNIYELQESHKLELRESVESMQNTINELSMKRKSAEERANLLRAEVQNLDSDLEKLRPYEQEVKEKNLLIGKLRHEAVILNEHLTKALRLLKRGTSNDSVDRQLLNNLLLSFFQLPRQDSKRFEVLKILSSVLSWDDVQKEQAGLVRPGSSASSLSPLNVSMTRSPPMSPTMNRGSMSRRTSGSVQLQAADFIGPNRESMSDLWINFLQSEAAVDAADRAGDS